MSNQGNGNGYALFTIKEASGRIVTANVHGNGGTMKATSVAWDRMLRLIGKATNGLPFADAYEPAPGHVRCYISKAAGNEEEGTIDLRGAVLVSIES